MPEIGIIFGGLAPYPDIKDMVKSEAEVVESVTMDQAGAVAEDMARRGVQAIISLGATADIVADKVDLPVVRVDLTNFDVLEMLDRVKHMSRNVSKIGMTCYYKAGIDMERIQKFLDVQVELARYRGIEDLKWHVMDLCAKGVDIIVGGTSTVRYAEDLGIRTFQLYVGKETLLKAIEKARDIVNIRRRDLERSEQLQAILRFTREGIIAVDHNGKVMIFNPTAEKLLGCPSSAVIGKPINRIMREFDWDGVVKGKGPLLDHLITLQDSKVFMNRVPIIVNGKVTGAVATLQESTQIEKLEHKMRRLATTGFSAKFRFEDIVGQSEVLKKCISRARTYAETDSTVLITGETGTGKELFAQSIHNASPRREGPFVAINCAALPENLLESELFGYEEGAFTGARRGGNPGLFELAHGGTIFLDEIGDLPLLLQARLLRVVQEKEVRRLGGGKVIPVDVRIICATNTDLEESVAKGRFRADLYHRLNVLRIHIPPLRERPEDIPLLLENSFRRLTGEVSGLIKPLNRAALDLLCAYTWPGNVRELENFAERYVTLREELRGEEVEWVRNYVLQRLKRNEPTEPSPDPLSSSKPVTISLGPLSSMERDIIQKAIEMFHGNKSRAADFLGVSRTTLWKKLKGVS